MYVSQRYATITRLFRAFLTDGAVRAVLCSRSFSSLRRVCGCWSPDAGDASEDDTSIPCQQVIFVDRVRRQTSRVGRGPGPGEFQVKSWLNPSTTSNDQAIFAFTIWQLCSYQYASERRQQTRRRPRFDIRVNEWIRGCYPLHAVRYMAVPFYSSEKEKNGMTGMRMRMRILVPGPVWAGLVWSGSPSYSLLPCLSTEIVDQRPDSRNRAYVERTR